MINKLKTIAIATVITGATLVTASAAPVTYIATNVLQPLTVSLTAYDQSSATKTASFQYNTKALLSAVEAAVPGTYDNKAKLAISTGVIGVPGTSNVVTSNVVVSVATNLVLSSNVYVLETNGAGTNFTLGVSNGNYVTISASNISLYTAGFDGPVLTSVYTNVSALTLNANQTVDIGSNGPVAVETNAAYGSTTPPVEAGSIVVISNGTILTNYTIGTNSFVFTTNSVTLGTNTITLTSTNEYAEISNSTSTFVILTNGTAPGLGIGTPLTNTLTTSLSISATNGATNLTVLTTTSDYTTNTENKTNVVTITNIVESSELVIADGTVNTPVPTNVVNVTDTTSIDIASATAGYTTMKLLFSGTNSSLTLHALVHSTPAEFSIGNKMKVAITNESWTDVSGYGTNVGTPIVLGGSASIGSPSIQKIP